MFKSPSLNNVATRRMTSGEFIALSACTMMLTALGIDTMLPSFGAVRADFHLPADSTATSMVIVFFFMGQVAQLFFGVMSDRLGRLPILRWGFVLYIVSGIVAAFGPTLPIIFVARFFAGVGSSAVFMCTIAGVRDRFVGDQMARIMSLVFTIFLFTPVIAPFLGVAILSFSSWHMVFLTPPLFAVLVFLWSFRLEESLPKEKRTVPEWKAVRAAISNVLSNKIFLRYTCITTLQFSVLSSYVASSEHIIGQIYKRPDLFPWIFAGIGLLMAISAFCNSYLSIRLGAARAIRLLLSLYAAVATVLLIAFIAGGDPPNMILFFVVIALLLSINIAAEPNGSAIAMEPMGEMAGIASSIYGTCFFFFGSIIGALISYFLKEHVFSIVLGFFLIGVLALLLVLTDTNSRKATA